MKEKLLNITLGISLAFGLVAFSANAQNNFISEDLLASNTVIWPASYSNAVTTASGVQVTNFTKANYPFGNNNGYASTMGLGTVGVPSQQETFELVTAQITGTNGGGLGNTFVPLYTGTNVVIFTYGLYLDDLSLALPAVTTIPGTTNPLPNLYGVASGYGTVATNVYGSANFNGTTNYFLTASNLVSTMFTTAATNFYGAKYFKILSASYVTTNAAGTNWLQINRLRHGHWSGAPFNQ